MDLEVPASGRPRPYGEGCTFEVLSPDPWRIRLRFSLRYNPESRLSIRLFVSEGQHSTMKSSFQQIILALQQFWADHGCLIAQPYYTQVGAGTMNPATFLRVLGPEPWNVAYVEPSVRPDDGRYGQNPNRFQLHTQYQVILKPDPGNPQELYLESLKAMGIEARKHDIRFVEDNWEQPAISAWGLGWEVWLDGQEITQFTYFQQMGGVSLDPISVEITYGLERILIALNNANAIWDEPWGADVRYGEIRRQEEFEHSKYYFETADVERLRQMYDLFSAEAEAALKAGLIVPAHDYVLKCSHAFNVLDTRGAISVAERQAFFRRMRGLARGVAEAYIQQRQSLEYPLLKESEPRAAVQRPLPEAVAGPADFVLEIGVEEMPAQDVNTGIATLKAAFENEILGAHKLEHGDLRVFGTPRRLVAIVSSLAPREADSQAEIKGPPEAASFDQEGKPTPALLGWARKNALGLSDEDLTREKLVREVAGGRYVMWRKGTLGSPATSLLATLLPELISRIKFDKSMRWNESGAAFSRPIRWIVAMHGEVVIPFEYAGVASGSTSRGLRPNDSPEIEIRAASQYLDEIERAGILLDPQARKAAISEQVRRAASFVGGEAMLEDDLLDEVTNLIEKPTAVLGNFNPEYLQLPREVLTSVMKKHQRYFPIEKDGRLMPNFVAVRNGDDQFLDLVQQGNEHVLGARFADADFFVREDLKHPLEAFRPRLVGLMFHAKLGSMLDKTERIQKLVNETISMLLLEREAAIHARRAARLCKADLVTKMVTEMTSLQGTIGGEYAVRSGEPLAVGEAISELYQPIPKTEVGLAVALADRIDSLVGLFGVGLAPTGAKDPFGLRRAALGIVQPLLEHDRDFDLIRAIQKAAKLQPVNVDPKRQHEVLDFLTVRLAVLLKEAGHRYDVVDAVLTEQRGNPAAATRAVKQLENWIAREDWKAILPAFARCVRITRDQKRKFTLDSKRFEEKEEKDLYRALQKAEASLRSSEAGDVDSLLQAFTPMIPSVNAFFEKVLVMANKKAVRQNRLALLQRLSSLQAGIADLSRLEGF
jgi:glycyl-tRNA synthetase